MTISKKLDNGETMKKQTKTLKKKPITPSHLSPEAALGKSQEYQADSRSTTEGRAARAQEYQPRRVRKSE